MRAFMSRVGARLQTDGPPRTFGGDLWGEMAVREARAILAETEPDAPWTASFGIERVAARNCAPSEWTGALADALAAFSRG